MRAALVVAQREFKAFLRSPLGYALLAVYALAAGLILIALLYIFRDQLLRAAQQGAQAVGGPVTPSVQVAVVTPYLIDVATLLLFVLPFVTMRAFAEERRSRSLELLISYPLRVWQIVLGKFLGVAAFAGLLLAVSVLHLAVVMHATTPDLLPLATGFAGLLLFALALSSVGLFVSSLAMGQVEAAVLTLGLFLVLAMGSATARPDGSWLRNAFVNLSPLYQYLTFGQGLLSAGAVLFFVAVTVLFLALTIRGVGLIKWRG